MGKEMINEVEFLIKMLEEEWSVSKETKEKIVINRIEAERFVRSATWVAEEIKKYIDEKGEEIEFDKYVRVMKQSWVMYRVVKKICEEICNIELNESIKIDIDNEEKILLFEYF